VTFLAAGSLGGTLTQPKGSVRSELIRQQAETGLTFAWIHEGVKVVSFKRPSIIAVEGYLDAFRPDGFSFQEYPEVMAIDMCWSHDQSKLAATMLDNPPNVSLEVLDSKIKTDTHYRPTPGADIACNISVLVAGRQATRLRN